MKPSNQQLEESLPKHERWLIAVTGIVFLMLLAVAVKLEPAPRGCGTHEQLGLPPCTFQVLFGKPCPSCGMTTSWTYFVRGQFLAACRVNLGGTILAIAALVTAPWLLLSAVRGRWFLIKPSNTVLAWFFTAVVLITTIDWIFRLWFGR